MKNRKIMKKRELLFACIAAVMLSGGGCDLSLEPAGDAVTGDRKNQLVTLDPLKVQSDVNGLYAGLIQAFAISSWAGRDNHFDFGYPAACLMFDASGMDMPSENSGYNWFNSQMLFTDRVANGTATYFLWHLFYARVKTANDIIAVIDPATTDKALKAYLGQALASRAFDYLHLAQVYQFTYKGHERALSVPLVLQDATPREVNDNPRVTLERLFEQIVGDLTSAIALLDGFDRRGKKEVINANVARGLRARAYLLMERWQDAADDAAKALEGHVPYSIEEVSRPSFNDIAAPSWIWGCAISENNEVVQTGIVNFPSHACSLTGNGYAPANAGRYINGALWNAIPAGDVRKGWWLDGKRSSPHLDTAWRITYNGQEYGPAEWFGFRDSCLNVKFGPYKDIYNNPTNACDFPLMRAEEMILVRAEALAMGGDLAGGKKVLEDFVKTCRYPAFASTATTAGELRDEIWLQRRVELWGEGFSLFDLKRLKKPLERVGTNFPAVARFNLPVEDPILLWLIPESEMNTNKGIQENNPVTPAPAA
ncbi:MAG: RagB/SusD family nutrient uptake outer membrane protein [Odoribacteraceae bacterium]|jgi:hypothetical protein|nr:RagB/SusD family nutrient uptake outer membrane protein [Odoribacteraceae bacterium]